MDCLIIEIVGRVMHAGWRDAIRPGPAWAAVDQFEIKIEGCGAHAMEPYKPIGPVLVGAQLVTALQQIVARNVDALERRGFRSVNSMLVSSPV